MSRFLNRCSSWMVWLSLAAAPLSASAFSMLGPEETWQTETLGYWRITSATAYPTGGGFYTEYDDFAWHPHNLGEEFRWNNPVLYYACDQSFLDYFGSNGVAAVDAAMAVFNNLTNVSSYSADLHEFPLQESRINYTAQALHLYDLKSTIMEMVIERLGLADPQNWTWSLHDKGLLPNQACPNYVFTVIQRNFDPVTLAPSEYVNGTLFTYGIQQTCPPAPIGDWGDAVEFLVDPDGTAYSALASPKLMLPDVSFYGWFHTGLTRDDVGGLRYLYATNNMNIEAAGTNSITFVPDTNTTLLLVTSNLTLLAAQSLTNDDAGLLALYPGLALVPGSTVQWYTNVVTTEVTAYYTNYPYDQVGTPPHLAYITNYDTNVMTVYSRQFANLVTNSYKNTSWVTVYDTNIYFPPNAPAGYFTTNVTWTTMLTNIVAGDFYIIPTNLCGVDFLSNQLTKVIGLTNSLIVTNTPTNVFGGTYLLGRTYVSWWTNHNLVEVPVLCVSNSIALRQGIEKVSFIRRDFDSKLGQFWPPITNYYTLTSVTNGHLFPQKVERVVTQPDILFSAADLAGLFIPTVARSTPAYDLTGEQPNLLDRVISAGRSLSNLTRSGRSM